MELQRYSDYIILTATSPSDLADEVQNWLNTSGVLEDNWIPIGGVSYDHDVYMQAMGCPIYAECEYKQVYEKSPEFSNLEDLVAWLNRLTHPDARPDLLLNSSNPFEHTQYRIHQIHETRLVKTEEGYGAIVRLELQKAHPQFQHHITR